MNREDLKYLKEGTPIVYPGQGVGIVSKITQQDLGGTKLDVVVLYFETSKMNVTIPLFKIKSCGLRPLSSEVEIEEALKILALPPKSSKLPWIRRQDQYETQINSGNVKKLAEALRDLNREMAQADTNYSYSKLTLFKKAMERMGQEISLVKNISLSKAIAKAEKTLGSVIKQTTEV